MSGLFYSGLKGHEDRAREPFLTIFEKWSLSDPRGISKGEEGLVDWCGGP